MADLKNNELFDKYHFGFHNYEDEDYEDEDYEDYEDEEENYKESLKGVSVKDTEKGLEIIIIGIESGVLAKYEIEINIKGYTEMELFDICYKIAEKIRSKYYEEDLTREMIVEIARSEFVK